MQNQLLIIPTLSSVKLMSKPRLGCLIVRALAPSVHKRALHDVEMMTLRRQVKTFQELLA